MNGFFGNMFDFNHDGKLDGFERTADFAMFGIDIADHSNYRRYSQANAIIFLVRLLRYMMVFHRMLRH